MVSVIITGHGNFATWVKSMLDLVFGECEKVYFVDFTQDLSATDLKQKFQEIYTVEKGNVVFLCDIAGGTPFNQASIIIMYEDYKQSGVIGGISIPLILDVFDQRESIFDMAELLNSARNAGCENIKLLDDQSDDGLEDDI